MRALEIVSNVLIIVVALVLVAKALDVRVSFSQHELRYVETRDARDSSLYCNVNETFDCVRLTRR